MELSIQKKDLAGAVGIAKKVVSSRQVMPILGGILLETTGDGIRLAATDLTVTVVARAAADVEQAGRTVIPAGLFSEVVATLKDGPVTLKLSEKNTLSISDGKQRAQIKCLDATDFPALPSMRSAHAIAFSEAEFGDLCNKTLFAVQPDSDQSRPMLNGVNLKALDGLSAFASNGYRTLWYKTDKQVEPVNAIITARALALVPDSDVSIQIDRNRVLLSTAAVDVYGQLIEAKFPDVPQFVPQAFTHTVRLDAADLKAALKAVAPFSAQDDERVSFTFDSGGVQLSAIAKEGGECSIDVNVSETNVEAPIATMMNRRYVAEGIERFKGEVLLSFNAPPNIVQFQQDESFRYFVSTMFRPS